MDCREIAIGIDCDNAALSVAARAVVDGNGVDRVLDAMADGMART